MPARWITDSKGDLDACLGRMRQGVALREALMGESPSDQLPYAGPLLDAVGLFERLGIGYALIGGMATMFYGRSRFTEDVDFVATSGHMDVLGRNADAMKEFKFDPACVWKLYHASGVDIDIWKDEYADAIVAGAREVTMAGRPVRIADPHDLVAMKLRAGRIQDDYDVSEILKSGAVDDALVQSRVSPEQFAHYLEIKRRTR